MRPGKSLLIAVVSVVVPCLAWAQPPSAASASRGAPRDPGRPGSVEVSASFGWFGPHALGSRAAQYTPGGSSTPFTLFEASARMDGVPAVDVRGTFNLTRRLAIEGGFVFSRPVVDVSIAADAESASGTGTTGETLSEYLVDANLLVFLRGLTFASGRGRAFVEGGAGYLRQLHAGGYSAETGTVFNGGGGVKYYFAPRAKGPVKGLGMRADLRVYCRNGGFSFDGEATWSLALGAGAVVAF